MADFQNPFVRGMLGAQAAANQNTAQNIGTLGGLLSIQNNMEMKPLQTALLRAQVEQAARKAKLLQDLDAQGGMGTPPGSAPPAFGESGISLPGGAQANLNTGQVIPQAAQPSQAFGGLDPNAIRMLRSEDPGYTAIGKAMLDAQKPINVRPGRTVYIPGQGAQYTAPGTNGTQINYGPNGAQVGILPGAIAAQTALGNTPLQQVTNPDQTISFVPKAQLAGAAGQPTFGMQPQASQPAAPQGNNPMVIQKAVQQSRDADRLSILYREREQQKASGRTDPALEQEILNEERKTGGARAGIPRFGQTQEQQQQQSAQTAANTEASKEFISEMRQNYQKLRDVPATLANMDRARQLAASSAKDFMGPFGESKLAITKFIRSNVPGMGNLDTSGVTNAEQLQSTLFNQVMDNLKKMDASPSQYQQQVMQEAFGTLRTDPQSVPKILDVFADILRNRVAIHNQTVQSAESRGTLFPYDVKVNLPNQTDKAISDAKQTQSGNVRRYNPSTGRIE